MVDYLEGKECINFESKFEFVIIIKYKHTSLLFFFGVT